MSHPKLQPGTSRELLRLRMELESITDPHNKPLGPPEFMDRYIAGLKCKIAILEGNSGS